MGGWCGTVNETLKAQITPSAAKVRHPRLAHNVNRHNSTKNSKLSFIPTSNHNYSKPTDNPLWVVSYLVPTSNHNPHYHYLIFYQLYLIQFLHQTTTEIYPNDVYNWLYLIQFLHQTTTEIYPNDVYNWLYLIQFLHQTTTRQARPQ